MHENDENKWKAEGGGGAITIGPSPPNQRCTAAKDGQLQGGPSEQRDAVECLD